MKLKHKRLTFVIVAMALLAVAAGLILSAFEDNIVFFYSPTDVAGKKIAPDRRIRLGGLVEEGSVKKTGGAGVTFRVTDLTTVIAVTYKGLLPDLFREGQGVIAEGRLKGGVFQLRISNFSLHLPSEDETVSSGPVSEIVVVPSSCKQQRISVVVAQVGFTLARGNELRQFTRDNPSRCALMVSDCVMLGIIVG